jgi:D-alanyl-lipoteichoic acid acyltransferase DltB (MBOAT superfamily)
MKLIFKITFIISATLGLFFAFKGLFLLKQGNVDGSDLYHILAFVCFIIASVFAYFAYRKRKNKNSLHSKKQNPY